MKADESQDIYCFECAERDIFVEANERKKGRRDKS